MVIKTVPKNYNQETNNSLITILIITMTNAMKKMLRETNRVA